GESVADPLLDRLLAKIERFVKQHPELRPENSDSSTLSRVNQEDAILITYADMVSQDEGTALRSLRRFLEDNVGDSISAVHLLPFYPYSSDDGFSVIDYRAVNPVAGDWEDIEAIGASYRLMFDAVINHISARSDWFEGYLQSKEPYSDYFIEVPEDEDLSAVFRPRELPLLTKVETAGGTRFVWTTFSDDQIDLNYGNPEVLLEIIDLLLYYVSRGAEFIRLDAIAYLWKEPGTSCIHMPQTHRVIQLIRAVLDAAAPQVSLITETNVPHLENISYFGDGRNEAQLVYNFSLPPLLLHTFYQENSAALTKWAGSLSTPSQETTFFNFTASHDGIGLLPAQEILSAQEIDTLVSRVHDAGGFVSYKTNSNGTKSPYELNINYLDALSFSMNDGEDVEQLSRRFLCSQAIMLSLKGVPGIYFHSLVGSRGWKEGLQIKGYPRAVNREKLDLNILLKELAGTDPVRQRIFQGYIRLLDKRRSCQAFHPFGEQHILAVNSAFFAILRSRPEDGSQALCLHNISPERKTLTLDTASHQLEEFSRCRDLITGGLWETGDQGILKKEFQPYDCLWLLPC
ncbi:MAG: sugar phosphorylase, partial [Candidatus Promineifilaceae bacterium]